MANQYTKRAAEAATEGVTMTTEQFNNQQNRRDYFIAMTCQGLLNKGYTEHDACNLAVKMADKLIELTKAAEASTAAVAKAPSGVALKK
jgi:hypothetical protein